MSTCTSDKGHEVIVLIMTFCGGRSTTKEVSNRMKEVDLRGFTFNKPFLVVPEKCRERYIGLFDERYWSLWRWSVSLHGSNTMDTDENRNNSYGFYPSKYYPKFSALRTRRQSRGIETSPEDAGGRCLLCKWWRRISRRFYEDPGPHRRVWTLGLGNPPTPAS